MNRRRVLQGMFVGGMISLAGCGDNENQPTDPSGGEEISEDSLPEYVFENDIQAEFVDLHRQSLQESTGFTIEFTDAIETQESITKNLTADFYSQQIMFDDEIVQEQVFYMNSDEVVSRYQQGDSYQYSRVESSLPRMSDIVEESRLKEIISESNVSAESISNDIVTFTGYLDLTYTAPTGEDLEIQDASVEMKVDTNKEVLTSVLVESDQVPVLFDYTVSNIGSNSFSEPEWVSEVPDTVKAVSGGFYREGNVIILQNGDESQLSEGTNLLVIKPSGESTSGQLQESVPSSSQAYLAFDGAGELDISVGELPETRNRQSLEQGTYIIIGTSDGEQVFEVQLSNR